MTDSPEPVILIDFSDALEQRRVSRGPGLKPNQEQLKQYSDQAINLAMGTVRIMAGKFTQTVRSLEKDVMPDEAEVEFGVRLDLETGNLVSTITKAGGGAQFNVRFKWNIERPNTPTVLVSDQR
jgi:hypothetical protein